MAEKAQEHSHQIDERALELQRSLVTSQIKRSEYGQRSARYIGFVALGVSLCIALFAGPVAGPICGAIFGLGGIGSLVWAYRRSSDVSAQAAKTSDMNSGSSSDP